MLQRSVDGTDRQTDGRTLDSFIDPASSVSNVRFINDIRHSMLQFVCDTRKTRNVHCVAEKYTMHTTSIDDFNSSCPIPVNVGTFITE